MLGERFSAENTRPRLTSRSARLPMRRTSLSLWKRVTICGAKISPTQPSSARIAMVTSSVKRKALRSRAYFFA